MYVTDDVYKINFKNNLIPSVIGVTNPNKNSPGPIRNCTNANTFLSHKLNIPDKTINNITYITIIMHRS